VRKFNMTTSPSSKPTVSVAARLNLIRFLLQRGSRRVLRLCQRAAT
jgi:hypothetical protein